MKLRTALTVSAIYLGLIGIGLLLFPRQFGIDAVPPDASPALLALLRLLGGPMVGIAVMNWLARDAEPSATRNAIVTGNLVGFALVTANDTWGVFSGEARPQARVFLVVHLLLTVAFVLARRPADRSVIHPGR